MTLILLLAVTLMMALAQPTSAQAGIAQPEKTVGYASVAPTLIGLGQAPTVNLWVNPLPTTYAYQPYFKGFYGVTVTFVRPDGTKDTFMPTDETGSYVAGQMQSLGALFFTHYVPNMVGNWSLSFTMPAQNITDSSGTVQYLGCTSGTAYFTVQADTVLAGLLNGYPWAELPNSNVYWSYPINDNNREWSQISGDWTGVTITGATVVSSSALRWQPYGSGPNTAHIVWTNPFYAGGMVGGDYGSLSYAMSSQLSAGTSPVVMDGKVFTNIFLPALSTAAFGSSVTQFQCFDESTGKVLYIANGSISYGIHMPGSEYAQSNTATQEGGLVVLPNSYGAYQYPYLWGSATISGITYWNYYDALTGTLIRQISNCSSARLVDGTILGFGAANSPTILGGAYLYRWNLTSVASNNQWPTGITWKVKMPTTLTGTYPSLFAVGMQSDVVVIGTKNQYWGYNSDTGASLWNITLPYPVTSNEECPLSNVDDFLVFDSTANTFHVYSMATGAELWQTPSFAGSPWATTYTIYRTETNDFNNMYISFPDGSMRAYSLTDGHLLWTSTPIPSTEYTENVVPMSPAGGLVLVGGNLYVYAGYSTAYQIDPVPRFSMILCINATTGDILYTLNGGVAPCAAANGYLLGASIFDGQLYCLGKGPTQTTVSAPQTAITAGTPVIISGSALDTSPASSSATLTAMFPNGVPAISDANMSVWMDYLHMQNSTLVNSPPICNGVPVTLTAIDPNGNVNVIGTATSDYQGNYGFQWIPTTPGSYHIFATFTGSNSYYISSASTYATVSSASTPTSSPTPTSTAQSSVSNSDMLMYLAIGVVVIIIAIAIATVLNLRKK